jgi:hypothetical protein
MKLPLKSLEFTCSQRPLKIVFVHLRFWQSFKILIGMRRNQDGDVNRNLIGKSLMNQFERPLRGARNIFLQDSIPRRQRNPSKARI